MLGIFQDWDVNQGNIKGRIVLVAFRAASAVSRMRPLLRWVCLPYVVLYRIVVEWILGIELPWRLSVGKGLRLYHGHALVVNDRARIGEGCVLRHCTTIGVGATSSDFTGDAPVIGDHVDIGSNVVIVGQVHVGNHATIGAGSVVISDVPAYGVAVGNPAKIVRIRTTTAEAHAAVS